MLRPRGSVILCPTPQLRRNHRHEDHDMNRTIRTTGFAAAVLVGFAASGTFVEPARADATPRTRSLVVEYPADALEREEGRQALQARIESAARIVCWPVNIKESAARRASRECREEAVAKAMAQVEGQRSAAVRR